VVQRERRDAGLEPARRAEQVPGHRLGGRDRQAARVVAERRLDRHRLEAVVERRRRAVRVDVVDFGGSIPALRTAICMARAPPSPSSEAP
jgi:hypothetical protein